MVLRYIVDHIEHIQVSFVHTKATKTIVRVGVVSPPIKKENAEKLIFAQLLTCIVVPINYIQMSFVHKNAI